MRKNKRKKNKKHLHHTKDRYTAHRKVHLYVVGICVGCLCGYSYSFPRGKQFIFICSFNEKYLSHQMDDIVTHISFSLFLQAEHIIITVQYGFSCLWNANVSENVVLSLNFGKYCSLKIYIMVYLILIIKFKLMYLV